MTAGIFPAVFCGKYCQNPRVSLGLVTHWYVNASTGNDNNDGLSPTTAFASLEKLSQLLCPFGTSLQIQQNMLVHVAAGEYGKLRVDIDNPADQAFFFWLQADFTSSANITLNSVTNSNPSGTRGEIETAAGTFVNKKRVRIVSGSHPEAVAYSSGLNGADPKKTFVSGWTDNTVTTVNAASGDVVAVDTLTVTIDELDLRVRGFGGIIIQDAILPNGGVCISNTLVDSIQIYRCDVAGEWNGKASIFASRVYASAQFETGFFRFAGNAYQATTVLQNNVLGLFEGSHLTDGARIIFQLDAQGQGIAGSGEPANVGWEFENGGAFTALQIGRGCFFDAVFALWGVTGNYTAGITTDLCSSVSYTTLPSIPSTSNASIAGTVKTWAQLPFTDTSKMSAIVH